MPSIKTSTTLSQRVSRLRRLRGAVAAAEWTAMPYSLIPLTRERCHSVCQRRYRVPPRAKRRGNPAPRRVPCLQGWGRHALPGENGFLLILDRLQQGIDIVWFIDELLQRRDHDRRGEVRSRIAIQELRDVL